MAINCRNFLIRGFVWSLAVAERFRLSNSLVKLNQGKLACRFQRTESVRRSLNWRLIIFSRMKCFFWHPTQKLASAIEPYRSKIFKSLLTVGARFFVSDRQKIPLQVLPAIANYIAATVGHRADTKYDYGFGPSSIMGCRLREATRS